MIWIYIVGLLLLAAIAWFDLAGGADQCRWCVAKVVRWIIRTIADDDEAETWSRRFENAANEGMRDRDAKRRRK